MRYIYFSSWGWRKCHFAGIWWNGYIPRFWIRVIISVHTACGVYGPKRIRNLFPDFCQYKLEFTRSLLALLGWKDYREAWIQVSRLLQITGYQTETQCIDNHFIPLMKHLLSQLNWVQWVLVRSFISRCDFTEALLSLWSVKIPGSIRLLNELSRSDSEWKWKVRQPNCV